MSNEADFLQETLKNEIAMNAFYPIVQQNVEYDETKFLVSQFEIFHQMHANRKCKQAIVRIEFGLNQPLVQLSK